MARARSSISSSWRYRPTMRGKKQRHVSDATPKELLVLSSPRAATRRATIKNERRRTPEQQALFEHVCTEWARSRGWPEGQWPKSRSYDAMLIGRMVVKLGAPIEFWVKAIAAVPRGYEFSWLVKGPQDGAVGRVEQWWLNELEMRRSGERVARQLDEMMTERGPGGTRSLGDILREAQAHG